ncbi:MAG TPA: hypothetical protein VGB73_02765 [Pyrinomonadaceae bacterium]
MLETALAARLQTRGSVGTCVALKSGVMRLSEIITVYLAAAAPVGVIYFLRQSSAHRTRTLLGAFVAAIVWPLALVAFRLERTRSLKTPGDAEREGASVNRQGEERIERAQRGLLSALARVEDASEQYATGDENFRQMMFNARSGLERYVGLALAAAEADAEAAPTKREVELCRVAGRAGADLELAGRCIHRRNVRRLVEHQERARLELLHAFAELRDLSAPHRAGEEKENRTAARRLSESIIETYARAIELLSTLEDRPGTLGVARLLDAECARLRRLELSVSKQAGAESAEGELCSTLPEPHSPRREPHRPLLHLSQTTPTSTRG